MMEDEWGASFLKTTVATEPARPVSPPTPVLALSPERKFVTSTLVLLSLAHFSVDFYSGSVATLQPVFAEHYSLSLTQAGLIGGVFMLSSAVMQPFFGLVSDRMHSRLFAVAGLAVAAMFLSGMGIAPGFGTLLLLIFAGGMGVAAFHPQSTSQVTTQAGARRGTALSIFMTAGMLGISCGPAYFSFLAERLGLESLYWAALPGLVVAGFLFWRLPADAGSQRAAQPVAWGVIRGQWKPLSLHYSLVVLRSVVQLALTQFLTLYLYTTRGFTLKEASFALTLFFAASAFAVFCGGGLADRIGGRRVVLLSMLGCVPFLAIFLGTSGWVSLLALCIGSFLLLLTNPVIVVMAQDLIPAQAGTASALMMGFGWGMAGITFIPLIGCLGDRLGLETVLWGVVLLPVMGFLLAMKLPESPSRGPAVAH